MKVDYAARGGTGPVYQIESDRHGSFTIHQDGRLLKRVTALTHYPGRPRWGSRELELAAIEEAKTVIEANQPR